MEDGTVLPSPRWLRPLSRLRNVWLIHVGETIVKIVDEIGDIRSWVFFWYRNEEWVELVEFESNSPPVEGIRPHFGEIVEYSLPVNPFYTCLMVREHRDNTIWWVLYCRVRFGRYRMMCAFQSRWVDVIVERMRPGVEEESDESSESEFVQLVFDI